MDDEAATYELEGDLRHFDLSDVLQLIGFGQKEGALRIQGERGEGVIYFDDGTATHAVAGDLVGDDAMLRIVQWREGHFSFDTSDTTDQQTVHLSIQHVILEAARQVDEWRKIEAVIPSLDTVVAFIDEPSEGVESIKLEPDEWKVLSLVDGVRSVRSLAEGSAFSEFQASRIIYRLLTSGLLRIVPAQEAAAHVGPPRPAAERKETVQPKSPAQREPERREVRADRERSGAVKRFLRGFGRSSKNREGM
ncbi:hypothetical protein AMJ71_02370 [candidate division TA06 bacterium SM1_40]|uniref:PatA-like N-terminal domain-containing protein n=2 Tax=Bacteria division TA06 TaxID=1156500 RepID=A0A0S8JLQ7_UNCT6|nr:MAG: hypothetical protein AMJ82_05130 [candidate division TA06 bacterium SM23_40]KPL10647.1 MAG: hypothetical protein AMJ71_02370 [candidate division TA06 bacterium SM1_40]